ncbi:hypothetical protein IWQ61_004571 [Dispira simplex]|nr:hypothetical protein IWQ61_004571 [Dispira simplex]
MVTSHPFYPVDLSLPHYVPSTLHFTEILGYFSVAVGLVILVVGLIVQRTKPCLSVADRLVVLWCCISGLTHIILEGYYVINHRTLAGLNTPLAELWKEYALADSRYLMNDANVLGVEIITTFLEGPAMLFNAHCILNRSSLRYPLQLVVSLGQIYGSLVYLFGMIYDDWRYMTPQPYYYYFYFWGMNSPWLLVPLLLIVQAWRAVLRHADIYHQVQARNALKKSH